MQRTERLVVQWLAKRGLRIERSAPVVFDDDVDPVAAFERSQQFRPYVVRVPLTHVRTLHWYVPDHRHPFVKALRAYRNRQVTTYEDSELRAFYESVRPASAAEALGVPPHAAPSLATLDPRAMLLPWSRSTPAKVLASHLETERNEAKANGWVLDDSDGSKFFGPVSSRKGQLQLDRLIAVYETIRARGWRRHDGDDGDARARLLRGDDGAWCAHIWTGQHRVAAAAALDMASIPVRFAWPPVHRSDAARWTQVEAGRIERGAAVDVFDRIMRGSDPRSERRRRRS
jgi:hypothetical protein